MAGSGTRLNSRANAAYQRAALGLKFLAVYAKIAVYFSCMRVKNTCIRDFSVDACTLLGCQSATGCDVTRVIEQANHSMHTFA